VHLIVEDELPSQGAGALVCDAGCLRFGASTRCCARVWGSGLNSPFDTICVGTGDLKEPISAGEVRFSSSLLR